MEITKLEDLTIQDYLVIKSLNGKEEDFIRKRLIEHFNLKDLTILEADSFMEKLNKALAEKPRFIQRFTLNNVEYGFIPNLDNITAAEWIDIDNYQSDDDNIHKLLSILYRPVIKKFNLFGLLKNEKYSIEKYNGTNDKLIKAPVEAYLGAMVFFYRLSQELLSASIIYTQKKIVKEMKKDKKLTIQQRRNLVKSLDGII